MQKSEICRAIAEKLEPNPSMGDSETRTDILSQKGYWVMYRKPDPVNPLYWKWEPFTPVDCFTSEDASGRLLDAMLIDPGAVQFVRLRSGPLVMDDGIGDDESRWFQGEIPDRKTAIVLAACKWLGIEVDGVED